MKRLLSMIAFLACAFAVSSATAYTAGSGFSNSCHERMTADALQGPLETLMGNVEVPVPEDGTWKRISDTLLNDFELEGTPAERFAIFSFLVGSRFPDTKGHAFTDTSKIRDRHSQSVEQYDHALRRIDDEGPNGNQQAVIGTRERIREKVDDALVAMTRPADEQIIVREIFIDFYGPVDTDLWAPAFHLGFASHIIQDSFSHMIRTADLKRVLHVLNFIKASRGIIDEDRDGLSHSGAMDDCDGAASEIAPSAVDATRDFYVAFNAEAFAMQTGELELFFMEWMSYEDGCTLANDVCDSQWLEVARQQPTVPSCSSTSVERGDWLPLALLLGLLCLGGLTSLKPSQRHSGELRRQLTLCSRRESVNRP